MAAPGPAVGGDQPTTIDLVTRTLDDARQLARTELELAKQELRGELQAATRAATDFAIAFACALIATTSLITSIVVARGGAPLALALAAVFLVGGAIAGGLGVRALPHRLMARGRRRLGDDVDRLKEHIA